MVGWYTSREPEMIPLVRQLASLPALSNEYASFSLRYGEYQEALTAFLRIAVTKKVPVPEHIVAATRAIADELVPAGLLTEPPSVAS